jgi:hypothetical protein
VWNGGQGGGDGGEEEEAGLGALEERRSEAQSSNASGSEAGLVSDYSKVGGGLGMARGNVRWHALAGAGAHHGLSRC